MNDLDVLTLAEMTLDVAIICTHLVLPVICYPVVFLRGSAADNEAWMNDKIWVGYCNKKVKVGL